MTELPVFTPHYRARANKTWWTWFCSGGKHLHSLPRNSTSMEINVFFHGTAFLFCPGVVLLVCYP